MLDGGDRSDAKSRSVIYAPSCGAYIFELDVIWPKNEKRPLSNVEVGLIVDYRVQISRRVYLLTWVPVPSLPNAVEYLHFVSYFARYL